MNRCELRARHALAACVLLLAACGGDRGAAATAGGTQDAFPGAGAGMTQAGAPGGPAAASQGGYTREPPPQGQMLPGHDPQGQYGQGQYGQGQYVQGQYVQGQYAQGQPMQVDDPAQHSGAQGAQPFAHAYATQPAGYPDPNAAQGPYGNAAIGMPAPDMPQQAGPAGPSYPDRQELERRYPEAQSQAQRDHQSVIDSIRSESGLR